MKYLEIRKNYDYACDTVSDINEHLPVLKHYADLCEHVTEFGVRGMNSTWALLVSTAETVISYDIVDMEYPIIDKWNFINKSSIESEIEETDFLFIDSLHTYEQLSKELELHHSKVKKYIGFHDTGFFGLKGEDGGRGLLHAIEEFLDKNENWVIDYSTSRNNGLMIIKRI